MILPDVITWLQATYRALGEMDHKAKYIVNLPKKTLMFWV